MRTILYLEHVGEEWRRKWAHPPGLLRLSLHCGQQGGAHPLPRGGRHTKHTRCGAQVFFIRMFPLCKKFSSSTGFSSMYIGVMQEVMHTLFPGVAGRHTKHTRCGAQVFFYKNGFLLCKKFSSLTFFKYSGFLLYALVLYNWCCYITVIGRLHMSKEHDIVIKKSLLTTNVNYKLGPLLLENIYKHFLSSLKSTIFN